MKALPFSAYTDPQNFEQELENIFLQLWLPVAHHNELTGDTCALERSLHDHSIVIVKENDLLRAFRNICPHRAGPLLWKDQCSPLKALRCRYHGWRYNLKGKRTHSPDFGTELEGHDLSPVALKCWGGIIFICLADQPPPFHWDALLQEHAPDLSQLVYHSQARHILHCNWKTYIENYLEGYHIPYLHPTLRSSISNSKYEIKVHDTLMTHHVPSDPQSPVSGFWAYLWPNTALNLYDNGLSIERVLPIDTHRCMIHYIYLFDKHCPPQDCLTSIEMSNQVTQEDIQVCNAIAKNLRAGVYMGGPLSPKHEHGLKRFHHLIKHQLSKQGL